MQAFDQYFFLVTIVQTMCQPNCLYATNYYCQLKDHHYHQPDCLDLGHGVRADCVDGGGGVAHFRLYRRRYHLIVTDAVAVALSVVCLIALCLYYYCYCASVYLNRIHRMSLGAVYRNLHYCNEISKRRKRTKLINWIVNLFHELADWDLQSENRLQRIERIPFASELLKCTCQAYYLNNIKPRLMHNDLLGGGERNL